eukprot:2319769-Ditylum_brightwellii.AAC.1
MEHICNNIINIQVRRAFALRHSIFATDWLLFHMPLAGCLRCLNESKRNWLESVCIAVHDFTVIHKRSPSQRTITQFFQPTTNTDMLC